MDREHQRRKTVVSGAWRNAWDRVIAIFAFQPDVRKIIKIRGQFPAGETVIKLSRLTLRNITEN
ncbi:hypothetical protein WS98_12180 [Burkholderia territorii]|nr:hypothetical protein WS98_12180 [Burkholderia territorii]